MRKQIRSVWLMLALAMIAPVAKSQVRIQKLAVSGYPGSIPVTQIRGKNYVEIEALAQAVNGSLSFQGSQITLTLTGVGKEATAGVNGLSKDFVHAGIEEISTLREWHSALASAIQNQYPLTYGGMAPYQAMATKNLTLAQAAATTDADQNALRLITNEYQKMSQLNDNYLGKRASMSYIATDALTNDALNQNIIACGRFLAGMAASGQFTDDSACH